MKKILFILILSTLTFPLFAQGQITRPSMVGFAYQKSGGAPVFTDSTTAFVNRLAALGGSALTDSQKARLDRWYIFCNTNSFYTKIVYFNLAFPGNITASAMNIMRPSTTVAGTWHGSPSIAAGGFTSNGSTQYLDIGYTEVQLGCAQNTTSLFCYSNTSSSTSAAVIGAVDASNHNSFIFPPGAFIDINDDGFGTGSAPSSTIGWLVFNRTASTTATQYRNATSYGSSSDASTGVVAANLYVGGYNNNGTASALGTFQIWGWGAGNGLTSANITTINGQMQQQKTWWGR